MDPNPFASPQVPSEHRAEFAWPQANKFSDPVQFPTYKLYSPGQVAWATFLGSPIAGCMLLAINYWRVGEANPGRLAVVVGIVATVCLMVVGSFLPEGFPGVVAPAASTFAMYNIAKSLQGRILERHYSSLGQTASSWRATGVAVLCLVGMLVVVFAVVIPLMMLKPDWFPE